VKVNMIVNKRFQEIVAMVVTLYNTQHIVELTAFGKQLITDSHKYTQMLHSLRNTHMLISYSNRNVDSLRGRDKKLGHERIHRLRKMFIRITLHHSHTRTPHLLSVKTVRIKYQ
jgi:hypothetical protein